jgi:hypothetical protein
MWFVPMPADPDAIIILRAENLLDRAIGQSEGSSGARTGLADPAPGSPAAVFALNSRSASQKPRPGSHFQFPVGKPLAFTQVPVPSVRAPPNSAAVVQTRNISRGTALRLISIPFSL